MPATHPLAQLLARIARDLLPPMDGEVEVFGAPPGPVDSVVGFTAHHCIAADVPREAVVERLPRGDLSAPLSPPFLSWLAGELGSAPGSLDMVLLAPEVVGEVEEVERRDDLADHPRVARAADYREDLQVFADRSGAGVLILGQGLARRWEVSVEVDPKARSAGLARRLAATARTLVPTEEPLWAQVAPANAASVRAFLAAGYRPIGAEVLFLRCSPS
jgi:hypothetical protein